MNGYFLLNEVYTTVFIKCFVFILCNRYVNQCNNVFMSLTDVLHIISKVRNLLTERSPFQKFSLRFQYFCNFFPNLMYMHRLVCTNNDNVNWNVSLRHHFIICSVSSMFRYFCSRNYLLRFSFVVVFASHAFVSSSYFFRWKVD